MAVSPLPFIRNNVFHENHCFLKQRQKNEWAEWHCFSFANLCCIWLKRIQLDFQAFCAVMCYSASRRLHCVLLREVWRREGTCFAVRVVWTWRPLVGPWEPLRPHFKNGWPRVFLWVWTGSLCSLVGSCSWSSELEPAILPAEVSLPPTCTPNHCLGF